MTMSCNRHAPIFDIHPVTGASIEIFYADRTLESFGKGGAGWFCHLRQRGFAPDDAAHGPFPTSYSAYRAALNSQVVTPLRLSRVLFDERCFHIASDASAHGSKKSLAQENGSKESDLVARPERFERPTLRFVVW